MKNRWRTVRVALLSLVCWGLGSHAFAFEFSGEKTISAHLSDGRVLSVGRIVFKAQPDGQIAFALSMDTRAFVDHFLSMREFKCLEGAGEIACHVPYPHPQPRRIRMGDWAWLEHNLLFMFKQPTDFGAKLWNGMYFQLADQGARLVGIPQSVDLNAIAAPPVPLHTPPFSSDQRSDMTAGQRLLVQLVIQ